MSNHHNLISELATRAETKQDSEAGPLNTKFTAMRGFLNDKYYPYTHDHCPYFTDHGEKHINSVIWTASMLLGKAVQDSETAVTFNHIGTFDIYLLLTAIIWHDAGMLSKRKGHETAVHGLLNDFLGIAFESVAEQRYVEQIIAAHSGKNVPLAKLPFDENYLTHVLHPRGMAAVLRFADEVSENMSRISLPLLDKGLVPEDNQIFWHYAKSIQASRPIPTRERVVINVLLDAKDALKQFKDPADRRKKIVFVEYLLHRIEKINQERAYCAPHFVKFCSIQTVELRLRLCNGTKQIEGYDETIEIGGEYPEILICDIFFVDHPSWKPQAIERVI